MARKRYPAEEIIGKLRRVNCADPLCGFVAIAIFVRGDAAYGLTPKGKENGRGERI